MSEEIPVIQFEDSLVAKHMTKERWDKVKDKVTNTSGFNSSKAIACDVQFDNEQFGIYAMDWNTYKDFAETFDAVIQDYHRIKADIDEAKEKAKEEAKKPVRRGVKKANNVVEKINGNVNDNVPVHSQRIRIGRSIVRNEDYRTWVRVMHQLRSRIESLAPVLVISLDHDTHIEVVSFTLRNFSRSC